VFLNGEGSDAPSRPSFSVLCLPIGSQVLFVHFSPGVCPPHWRAHLRRSALLERCPRPRHHHGITTAAPPGHHHDIITTASPLKRNAHLPVESSPSVIRSVPPTDLKIQLVFVKLLDIKVGKLLSVLTLTSPQLTQKSV